MGECTQIELLEVRPVESIRIVVGTFPAIRLQPLVLGIILYGPNIDVDRCSQHFMVSLRGLTQILHILEATIKAFDNRVV
jgi:hypothetical protein